MGRPWLTDADFIVPLEIVNNIIEKNLISENELKYVNPANYNLPVKNKMLDLKNYYLHSKNIYMDNYGDPIYSSDQKNIIGYNLMEGIYAEVERQPNEKGYKINKIYIKDYNSKTNSFKKESLINWTDIVIINRSRFY